MNPLHHEAQPTGIEVRLLSLSERTGQLRHQRLKNASETTRTSQRMPGPVITTSSWKQRALTPPRRVRRCIVLIPYFCNLVAAASAGQR
jgi:hypothetical protein